jgi:hypothetical protein
VIPSALVIPFALASKLLHDPLADNIPSSAMFPVMCGLNIKLEPATTAPSIVPALSAAQASCRATREAEHAVLMSMLYRSS